MKFNIFSQSSSDYYISVSNDTVLCKIIDFSPKRVYVTVEGVRKKFKPHEIKCVVFSVGNKFVSLINDKQNFYREVIVGKISFYTFTAQAANYPVIVKDDKIVWLNVLNPRKRISNFISDCPELLKEWTEGTKYTLKDKEAIVIAYNNCMSH